MLWISRRSNICQQAGKIGLILNSLARPIIQELFAMQALMVAYMMVVNSHRHRDILLTRLGKTPILLHNKALIRSLTTLHDMKNGKRCMTEPSGSIQLPAQSLSLAKPTRLVLHLLIKSAHGG